MGDDNPVVWFIKNILFIIILCMLVHLLLRWPTCKKCEKHNDCYSSKKDCQHYQTNNIKESNTCEKKFYKRYKND